MSIICFGFDTCKGFCVHMNGWCFPGMMNMKRGRLVNSFTSSRFKAKSAWIQAERNRKKMRKKKKDEKKEQENRNHPKNNLTGSWWLNPPKLDLERAAQRKRGIKTSA